MYLSVLPSTGVTLRFRAGGLKMSFDENKWSKTGFLVIFHTIFGP